MNIAVKLVLALVTVGPLCSFCAVMLYIFYTFAAAFNSAAAIDFAAPPWRNIFEIANIVLLWELIMILAYVRMVGNDYVLSPNRRAVWAMAVIFGGPFIQIAYWFLYIWRHPQNAP